MIRTDRTLQSTKIESSRSECGPTGDMADSISVLVCTDSKSRFLEKTLRSLLTNDGAFEVVIVDQGRSSETASLLERFDDPRVRYVPSETSGLPAARNLGTSLCGGSLVAVTDDDCEVDLGWLRHITEPFRDQRIGVVFGNVLPAPHDSSQGFIPSYVRRSPGRARTLSEKHLTEGMGACFAFRRRLWEELHGFDPLLGRGATLRSAGETDFSIGALFRGYHIYETPRAAVTHHGFRTWTEGEALVGAYLYGVGAIYVKWLRRRQFRILLHMAKVGRRFLRRRSAVYTGVRFNGRLKLKAFVCGARAAWRQELAKNGHFMH